MYTLKMLAGTSAVILSLFSMKEAMHSKTSSCTYMSNKFQTIDSLIHTSTDSQTSGFWHLNPSLQKRKYDFSKTIESNLNYVLKPLALTLLVKTKLRRTQIIGKLPSSIFNEIVLFSSLHNETPFEYSYHSIVSFIV